MTNSELKRVFTEAKDELARRDAIDEAITDIKKVLTKYKLRPEDIDWRRLHKKVKVSNGKKPCSKSNSAVTKNTKKRLGTDNRSSVAPKYLNPNGKERWTGRGRAPGWVVNICEQENIDIESFKLDLRFRI